MNEIKTFTNKEFGDIRTLTMSLTPDPSPESEGVPNGEIWFVGKDVATALGYVDTAKAIKMHVDDEDKTTTTICLGGSNYKTQAVIINESGLYSLILASKLPSAKAFKHWVTAEVLPQIRQTGGYIPLAGSSKFKVQGSFSANAMKAAEPSASGSNGPHDDEDTILAKAIVIAKKTIDLQQKLLDAQRPDVAFAKAVTSAENSILIRDLAKLITQNGVPIGQARLFYWLRLKGYLFKHERRPIQRWVEEGLFDTNVSIEEGRLEKLTTMVTPKGQRYFLEGFMSGRFKAQNGSFQ